MDKKHSLKDTGCKKCKCALILNDLNLKLNLGVTAKERAKKQTVLVTAKISFPRLPLACKSGKISDAICYYTLIQKIKEFCKDKKFTLIENLGMQLFVLIKKNIFKNCKLSLRVAKQYPLKELPQSVFEISD
ncbi:MAG: dihydroneopterin aldolase [Gammaproteobacteria bacterium]|nr:dihydroneopterin aldolase [Gammaproteobacteria bacterium]